MNEKIYKLILENILKENNQKISIGEKIEDYFTSFKTYELARLSITNVYVNSDYGDLYKVKNLANRPKKYIIDYITNNLKKIIETYVKICTVSVSNQLKLLVSKDGNLKYKLDNFNLNMEFILFLKNFALAKVNYNKKEETIHIYMPKEIVNIFKDSFKNKNIIKYNERFNNICDYVKGVMEAYGMIPLTKLHEIYEKEVEAIDIHELNLIIGSRAMTDEIFNIYSLPNDMLICGLEFHDEDEAILFYEKAKGEYHEFSKEEFKQLSDYTYINHLGSYIQFVNYLCKNYDGIQNDIENIREFTVMDYISTAQLSISDANKNFMSNIDEIIDGSQADKEKLRIMVNNIFNQYPKWKKRGNK